MQDYRGRRKNRDRNKKVTYTAVSDKPEVLEESGPLADLEPVGGDIELVTPAEDDGGEIEAVVSAKPVRKARIRGGKPGGGRLWVKIVCCVLAVLLVSGSVTTYLNWYDIVQYFEERGREPQEIVSLATVDPDYALARYQYSPAVYADNGFGIYDKIYAVQAVIGVDYYKGGEGSFEDAKKDIDALLDAAAGMGNNTVIFELQGEQGTIAPLEGYKVLFDGELLRYAVSAARDRSLRPAFAYSPFEWVGADGRALVYDPMLAADREAVLADASAIAALGADIIVMSGCFYREGLGRYADYAALGLGTGFEVFKRDCLSDLLYDASVLLRGGEGDTAVGLAVQPVWRLAGNTASGIDITGDFEDWSDGYADTKAWLSSNIFDFVQVEAFGSLTDTEQPFQKVFDWWADAAGEAGIPLVVMHAADKAATSAKGWSLHDQLPKQIVEAQKSSAYGGSVLRTVTRLLQYPEIRTVIGQTYKGEVDGDDILRNLTITAPSKKTTKTYESMITLTGSSDPNFSVSVNGTVVERTSKGYFALNFDLAIGDNVYVIEHKGASVTYTVDREVLIFKSVSPSEKIEVYAGTPVVFNATALKGSTIYAMIDGVKVPMEEDTVQPDEEGDKNSDYINYTGFYTLPENTKSKTIKGIKIYGDWQGYKDEKSCANVSVKEIDLSLVRVATVVSDYAEVFRGYTVDDKSVPTEYPMIKGTRDYVVSEVVYSIDGDVFVYYNLRSGKRIYKSENGVLYNYATIEYNGKVENNSIGSVTASVSSKYTTIKIEMGSKVPFNIQLDPQDYKDAYSATPDFTVASSTADSVIVSFNYTVAVSELPAITGSPLISGISDWTQDNANFSFTLSLKQAGKFFGVYAYYEGSTLVLDFVNPPVMSKTSSNGYGYNLSGITVMLDPGHGGKSSGAVGANPNYPEKRVNLDLALRIKAELEKVGAKVIMTRATDVYLTLAERVALCEKYKPDLFLSVHHNAASNVNAKGVSTFYFNAFSKNISNNIYQAIGNVYKNSTNSLYTKDTKQSYLRGCMYYPMAVTRHWFCPSTLLEYGFMSNSAELQIIIDPATQAKFAQATVNGIINYIKQYGTIGANNNPGGGENTSSSPDSSDPDIYGNGWDGSGYYETDEGFYTEDGQFSFWGPEGRPSSSAESSVESSAESSVESSADEGAQ